jgi:hypothetical protein
MSLTLIGKNIGIVFSRYNLLTSRKEWTLRVGFCAAPLRKGWPRYCYFVNVYWYPLASRFSWSRQPLGTENGKNVVQYLIRGLEHWPVEVRYGRFL